VGVSTIPLDTSILRSNSDRYRYDDHDDDEHRTWFFFCFHASTKESKDDEITCLENQIQSLFYSLKIRYKKNKDEYIVRHYHECGSIHIYIEQDYTISISSDDLPKGIYIYIMAYYSNNNLRKIHRLAGESM